MDPSPPKRITRARAAAKSANDSGIKTTRIATAASKVVKPTRTTTATKRKTRADEENDKEDNEEDDEEMVEDNSKPQSRTTRGRPKKIIVRSEPEMQETTVPAKATRGRPKRAATEAAVSQPTRSLRGRAKKDEEEQNEPEAIEEPPKKTTRTRAPTVTRATGPKKTVKFEEPDKENIIPPTRGKPKAETATGLRAKPVRKPAASTTASTRSTRGRAKAETVQEEKVDKPMPLSPKKATQVNTNKGQSSEDELSTAVKTPMKPLSKSPVKPPGSIFGTAKKLDFSASIVPPKPIFETQQDLNVSTMMSPARRLPQTMEKRLDLTFSFGQKPTTDDTQEFTASAMGSPARRPPQSSPFKDMLKASPQKLQLGDSMRSPFKPNLFAPEPSTANSPFKASLLQSPARRPPSPTKVNDAGSPTRTSHNVSIFNSTPKASTFKISRFATPRTLQKSAIRTGQMLPPSAMKSSINIGTPVPEKNESLATPIMEFSGRLSSILPRSADPAFASPATITPFVAQPVVDTPLEKSEEPMVLDDADDVVDTIEAESTTPTCSPPRNSTGNAFGLREEKTPFDDDSESEDELASGSKKYSPALFTEFRSSVNDFASSPATPANFNPKTPKSITTQRPSREMRRESRSRIGFTPLAKQLSEWMAASPDKSSESELEDNRPASPTQSKSKNELYADMGSAAASPAKSTFFEDEMTVRDELDMADNDTNTIPEVDEPEFDDVDIVEEDLDLAQEADEMSLLDPEAFENEADIENQADEEEVQETTLSEASQEYGDENEVPIDPALLASVEPQESVFSTPKRVLTERTFHTVSKVPLKEAHETPVRPSPMKRSATAYKLPAARPTSALSRNNTVISYSPVKKTPRSEQKQSTPEQSMQEYATPTKPEASTTWATAATPARTPRPDLNTSLLKGAVVFVDVHTTEGADASGLFTELLTQMGAKCVKTWSWNPKNNDGDESKIGITHVVFKDGGKRTLEKAKETGGVVSCVGVGWVLDCERENKWLDEASYAVDTAMIPRGGHRRRKSMEPKALANLNGTLVPSTVPAKSTFSSLSNYPDLSTPLTNKSKRRQSVQWERSPVTEEERDERDELGDDAWMLSPVPATPAPEAISAYAEEGLWGGETPGAQTPYYFKKEELVQMTAPGGKKFIDAAEGEGEGTNAIGGAVERGVDRNQSQSMLMRLMAARRKSLQWAPKVGSPLARGGFRRDSGL